MKRTVRASERRVRGQAIRKIADKLGKELLQSRRPVPPRHELLKRAKRYYIEHSPHADE